MSTNPSISARRAAFRTLHESGFFVLPNPWDAGTARYLRSLGFKALATTSAGLAFTQGLPDADWAIPRDAALEHIRSIVAAVDLPINADFESGYGHTPDEVAANVRLCASTGVAGLSIEDATGNPSEPLYTLPLAVERIRAAREALAGTGVLLTARAECFLVHCDDPLRESIRRLTAYAEAGADVLYAPGASSRAEVEAIVAAVHPKPVNILVGSSSGLSLTELAAIGVRRASVGSALARAAWTGFIQAARLIARNNSLEGLHNTVPYSELNDFFRKDYAQRAIEEDQSRS
ncbi:isocitrate lyase/PEP mutase family protein [Edaphobacter flagellatus]|uniref:isocitrate lyase/PEP mutase family protein n=1 Tax=Edaphobacter flagellatus TaxID=1933044 RepID=UPI0021B4261C|nr:isocitrate lyase/phosphoenolpyruvate mutase family protein [Edaphobacter flagellatus]